MRFKSVLTYDPRIPKIRVFRLLWQHGVMMQGGYSAKLSFSLVPAIYGFVRLPTEWRLNLLGIEIHYMRAYGGIIP